MGRPPLLLGWLLAAAPGCLCRTLPGVHPSRFGAQNGRQRRVVDAFLHGWKAYREVCWGQDELLPVARKCSKELGGMGAQLVDALDTLLLMGLQGEYEAAMEWVVQNFTSAVDEKVSVFETVIRLLGGLLSAHFLDGDKELLRQAWLLGERLLPAWREGPIPHELVNLLTGEAAQRSELGSSLAEVGSLQLEFTALTAATGDPLFRVRGEHAMDLLGSLLLEGGGLLPIMMRPTCPLAWTNMRVTLGGRGDSFYEYLLKQWLLTNRTEERYRKWYRASVGGIRRSLVGKSSPSGLAFVREVMTPEELEPWIWQAGLDDVFSASEELRSHLFEPTATLLMVEEQHSPDEEEEEEEEEEEDDDDDDYDPDLDEDEPLTTPPAQEQATGAEQQCGGAAEEPQDGCVEADMEADLKVEADLKAEADADVAAKALAERHADEDADPDLQADAEAMILEADAEACGELCVSFFDVEGQLSNVRLVEGHPAVLKWFADGTCYDPNVRKLRWGLSDGALGMSALIAPQSGLFARMTSPAPGEARDAMLTRLARLAQRAGVELEGFERLLAAPPRQEPRDAAAPPAASGECQPETDGHRRRGEADGDRRRRRGRAEAAEPPGRGSGEKEAPERQQPRKRLSSLPGGGFSEGLMRMLQGMQKTQPGVQKVFRNVFVYTPSMTGEEVCAAAKEAQEGRLDELLDRVRVDVLQDREMSSGTSGLSQHTLKQLGNFLSERLTTVCSSWGYLKMDHLACFLPGVLALGAMTGAAEDPAAELELAAGLAEGCAHMWLDTPTGLAAEASAFNVMEGRDHDLGVMHDAPYSMLRPETVESLWYMYVATGDTKYQDWGWRIFEAIEKYGRLEGGGYCGIEDVREADEPRKRDRMETFLLSETFKYLFLLFADDQPFDLERVVLNTEGHPLPVVGAAAAWGSSYSPRAARA